MEITRESLEKHIKNIEAQKAQFVGNVNMSNGALMLARQLLSDLDREDETDGGREKDSPPDGDTDAPNDEG